MTLSRLVVGLMMVALLIAIATVHISTAFTFFLVALLFAMLYGVVSALTR